MKSDNNAGRKWPWIIIGSILAIIGMAYWTINLALNNPVQMSDLNMQKYQKFDTDVNEFIRSRIAFDQKYDLLYKTDVFKEDSAIVKFKLTDKSGNAVNDAKMTLKLTRPNTHDFNMDVPLASVEEGVYIFAETVLPKPGRWDILLHVASGENERFMNLKADTRYGNVFEY